MTVRKMNEIARIVALRAMGAHSGDINDPESWVAAGRHLGAKVHGIVSGDPGFYVPGDDANPGIIFYNQSRLPISQCRVLVHEIAHHLEMSIVPGCLFESNAVQRFEGDGADIRHRIACEVERIIFKKKR